MIRTTLTPEEKYVIEDIRGEEIATFGGGCYRCVEAIFQRLRGVTLVESGFMGGAKPGPSYEEVCKGKGGHIEVVQIHFNPEIISYQTLLTVFFTSHNPTQLNAQGNDIGEQYASVIFTHTPEQASQAQIMIDELKASKVFLPHTIVTQVRPATEFRRAEGYHQNFYNQNQTKPYCSLVIDPKLAKLRKQWGDLLKSECLQEDDE